MSESGTQALPFGGIADRYDRFRPGVPTAPDWLLPDSCGTEFVGHVGTGACAIESPRDFRRLRTAETPATAP
ncbi:MULTISPECIES: hypothetical protein [unclassified Streptomyces]|uniref:hypothetical protein n=1 Tax=Streptomyces sp. NPDC055082 TaxID=3365718 RepID=UPI0037D17727